MTSPWWSIDIASHAKFDSINFNTFGHYVADLNMTFNMLILPYFYNEIR